MADPPPRVQDLRHTRRCGPALPHGPPTPEALRLPQHWKNRPQSPPREAPRGPNCLRCRRVGVLFSRLAPPSPFRLRSKELPRCPLAGGSCRSPRSQRGPLYPCGREAVRHKAPPPPGLPRPRKEEEPQRPQPMGSRRGQRLELRWWGGHASPSLTEYEGTQGNWRFQTAGSRSRQQPLHFWSLNIK